MNPGVTLHAMLLDFIISPTENQNKQKEQHRYNFNYLIKLSYIRPFGIYNNRMSYSSHLDYTRHMLHENYNKLIKANIRDGQNDIAFTYCIRLCSEAFPSDVTQITIWYLGQFADENYLRTIDDILLLFCKYVQLYSACGR